MFLSELTDEKGIFMTTSSKALIKQLLAIPMVVLIMMQLLFVGGCVEMKVKEPAVVYPALIIDPEVVSNLEVEDNVQFFTEGGKAPYRYTVVSGAGNIGLKSGFYTAGTTAGAVKILVQDSAGHSAYATINVISLEPYQLQINGPAEVLTSDCQEFTIHTIDKFGNNARRSDARTITLTGASLGAFYSDLNCSIALDNNQFELSEGDTDQPLYYKNNVLEGAPIEFVAATDGLSNGTHLLEMITSGVATKFYIVPISGSITVGPTGHGIQIQARDATNAVAASYSGTVRLAATGNAAVAGDGTVTITNGYGSINVSNLIAEQVTISLERTDFAEGTISDLSDTEIINFSSDVVEKVIFKTITDSTAGTPTTIEIITVDGNNNPVAHDIVVQLQFSDGNDSAEATSGSMDVSIVGGLGSIEINNNIAEVVELAIVNTGVLTYDDGGAAQSVEFFFGEIEKYVVLNHADVAVNGTANILVQAQDHFGNRVFGHSGSVSIATTGSAAVGCSGILAIVDGQSGAAACQLTDSVAETVNLVLSNPDLASGVTILENNTVAFTAGGLDHYTIEAPTTVAAGNNSAEVVIKAVDATGVNVVTSVNCNSGIVITDDSNNSSFSQGNVVTFVNGEGRVKIYNEKAETVQYTLTLPGGGSCAIAGNSSSDNTQFLAASVTNFVLLKPTDTIPNVATIVRVEARDQYGNINTFADNDTGYDIDLVDDSSDVTIVDNGIDSGIATFNVTGAVAEIVSLSMSIPGGSNVVSLSAPKLLVINDCAEEGFVYVQDGPFCISKYQMDSAGGSTKNSLPKININRADASAACVALGGHLVTNNEWQTVAREIIAVASNWSIAIGSGSVNRGHSNSLAPNSRLAASDDYSPCAGYTDSRASTAICSDSVWHVNRRTHTLKSGAIIWDFSGNTVSWVSTNRSSLTFDAAGNIAIKNILLAHTNDMANFGPGSNDSNNHNYGTLLYNGMGLEGMVRGLSWDSATETDVGIFSASVGNFDPTFAYSNVGYRCVIP